MKNLHVGCYGMCFIPTANVLPQANVLYPRQMFYQQKMFYPRQMFYTQSMVFESKWLVLDCQWRGVCGSFFPLGTDNQKKNTWRQMNNVKWDGPWISGKSPSAGLTGLELWKNIISADVFSVCFLTPEIEVSWSKICLQPAQRSATLLHKTCNSCHTEPWIMVVQC